MTKEKTVEATAKLLAAEHIRDGPDISAVYWAPAKDEVLLLEVCDTVHNRGEILPFRFAPDPPDVPFPYVVVLLGPGDWQRVRKGELELPEAYADLRLIGGCVH